jgi:acyl-coenzyme A thioesterase PaaI-like protein
MTRAVKRKRVRRQDLPMGNADQDDYRYCFACGRDNPIGLKLAFRFEEGKAKAEFTPGPYHQSWNTIFHGGLLALCLDEAFGYVLAFRGIKGLTAKMEVRLRRPVHIGQKIFITGELKKQTRKLIETYAKAELGDGSLAAEATAVMYVTGQELSRDSAKKSMAESVRNRYNSPEEASKSRRDVRVRSLPGKSRS